MWIESLGSSNGTMWYRRFSNEVTVTTGDTPPWDGDRCSWEEALLRVRGGGVWTWKGFRRLMGPE